MNTFMNMLKIEQKRIQRLIDLTALNEGTGITGSLQLERRGDKLYLYEHIYEKGRRIRKRYLGTPASDRVCRHVRARVAKERLHILKHDQLLLEELKQNFKDYDLRTILANLPNAYQLACEANAAGDAFGQRYEELKQWAASDYPRNTTPFMKAENFAKDGTRTRSKGETFWYDSLLDLGVLFWYDCIITITDRFGNKKTISPDFLIQCFDGSFIIIEHLGLLHDKGYAIDYGEKCYWYLHEGFILGKSFFVTSDDMGGGTDSRMIEAQAQQVARLFFGY